VPKPELKLTPHAVVFVDLLGFRELLSATADPQATQDLLEQYSDVIDVALDVLGKSDRLVFSHWSFSDSFLLAASQGADDWESAIGFGTVMVAHLQLEMVLRGWFVRGGFSLGPFYGDNRIVFGPAFLEAYEVETNLAIYPRITMTDRVLYENMQALRYYANPYESPQNGYVLVDSDNTAFVNYLYTSIGAEQDRTVSVEVVRKHKQVVERSLQQFRRNPHLLAKYQWVAAYHNFFVTTWLKDLRDQLTIASELVRDRPVLLVPKDWASLREQGLV
jgi:hypothetical protein